MPDREKVIKGLCDLRRYLEDKEWSDNRVDRKIAKTYWQTVTEAIELLKEREPLAIRMIDNFGAIKFGCCPTCNAIINNRGYPKSCGCGQSVKWK